MAPAGGRQRRGGCSHEPHRQEPHQAVHGARARRRWPTCRSPRRPGGITTLLGPVGLGQVDRAAHGRRPRAARQRAGAVRRARTSPRLPAQKRGLGFVFQSYALFKHMNVRKNIAFGLGVRKVPPRTNAPQGRRAAVAGAARRPRRSLSRRSCRAGSGSAWRSRARWPSSPRCCCSTSRSARWTRRCASSCATGCAAFTTSAT